MNNVQHAGRPSLTHAAKRGRNHNALSGPRRISFRVLIGIAFRKNTTPDPSRTSTDSREGRDSNDRSQRWVRVKTNRERERERERERFGL